MKRSQVIELTKIIEGNRDVYDQLTLEEFRARLTNVGVTLTLAQAKRFAKDFGLKNATRRRTRYAKGPNVPNSEKVIMIAKALKNLMREVGYECREDISVIEAIANRKAVAQNNENQSETPNV